LSQDQTLKAWKSFSFGDIQFIEHAPYQASDFCAKNCSLVKDISKESVNL